MPDIQSIIISQFKEGQISEKNDVIALEEPLEISVAWGQSHQRQRQTIAVTMRTPDSDGALALGFLFTEGVIFSKKDVLNKRFIDENRLLIDLSDLAHFNPEKLNRHFYTTSSCGVCGKASLEAVSQISCFILKKDAPKITASLISTLSNKLLAVQQSFSKTGGTHASVLFNTEGEVLKICEDVGRHNALDKLIGWAFQEEILPLSQHILLVSGRTSFELVQKAAMAGIPIIVSIGAPSSLAVKLAEEHNMTLIGFLKEDRFNIYSGIERINP